MKSYTYVLMMLLPLAACGAGLRDHPAAGGGVDGSVSAPTAWKRVPVGTEETLNAVFALTPSDAWAVGDHGKIVRWNGKRWLDVPTRFAADLSGVWASGRDDAWAIGGQSIYHWNGQEWSTAWTSMGYTLLLGISGSGADDVWVVGGSIETTVATLLRWDGQRWQDMSRACLEPLIDIFAVSPALAFMNGCRDVEVWNGAAWTRSGKPDEAVYRLWAASSNDAWATAAAGKLLHFDGSAWTVIMTDVTSPPNGRNAFFPDIWGAASDDLWAISSGAQGLLAHWNGSAVMTVKAPNLVEDMYAIHGTSSSDVWMVGEKGTIYHLGP